MEKKPLGFLLGAGVSGHPIPIGNNSITSLGRDENNTIPLDDLNASREHAFVEARDGLLFITDLDSSNGTFVDDIRIKPHERILLKCGQEIRIGGRVFFVLSTKSPLEPQKLTLSKAFSKKQTLGADFSLKVPNRKDQTPKAPPAAQPAVSTDHAANLEPASHVHTLSGAINAGSLPQIIQMISSKRFSGSMKVTSDARSATILFANGELHAAFSPREKGTSLIYKCALEQNAHFTFEKLEASAVEISPRNIKADTMQILMECCCRIHEAKQS